MRKGKEMGPEQIRMTDCKNPQLLETKDRDKELETILETNRLEDKKLVKQK